MCQCPSKRLAAAQAIQQLTKLAPASALLLTRDEEGNVTNEQEVPIALVQRGDVLKVGSGQRCHILTTR